MIADTVMANYKFVADQAAWFEDRQRVIAIVDAVLGSPFGARCRYAGIVREAKKADTAAAVHALIATGKDDVFVVQDDKKPIRFTAVLTIARGSLAIDARCYQAELAERAASVLGDMTALAVAIRATGALRGLHQGFVRPITQARATYEFDRVQPRAARRTEGMLRSGAVVDLIDVRLHGGDHSVANPREVALAHSDLPPGAQRTERDGLVEIRWVDALTDKAALDRACEAHEDWIDRHLPAGAS
jgi:hypothetical protein